MSDSDFGFDGGESDSDFGLMNLHHLLMMKKLLCTDQLMKTFWSKHKLMIPSGDDDVVATAEIVTRKRCCRRYTIQEKLMILRQVRRRMNNGASQRSVCNSININRKLINDWNKQFPQLIDATNNKAKSLCKGMKSCLFSFSDSLLSFILNSENRGWLSIRL